MTEKARRRREIVYWIEQGIVCAIAFGGFAAFLKTMNWLLTMAGVN